jgi:hypothetical protein
VHKKLLCAVFVILFSLVACQQPAPIGDAVNPTMDRSGQIQQIKVVVHPSFADVNRAYDKYSGVDMPEVYGWSGWSKDLPGQCEIHVTKPRFLGTHVVETWGHELMHCVYGSYHPE